jgi:hypothetical protein
MRDESFRLPVWPWAAIFGGLQLPFVVVAAVQQGVGSGLVRFAVVALFVSLMFWIGKLSISPAGIVLYRINRLTWGDAVRARLRTFAGLPYLYVERHRGMSWWIPLYFVGRRDVRQALAEGAPDGNPIRQCLVAQPNKALQPTRACSPRG